MRRVRPAFTTVVRHTHLDLLQHLRDCNLDNGESPFRVLSLCVLGDLRPRLEDDRPIEIKSVLVVLPAAQSLVLLAASKEPQHVEGREVVLDALQRRPRVHQLLDDSRYVPRLARRTR